MEKSDEEKAITNRISAKEKSIKIMTAKYLELIKKFNISTRNEIKSILDEILNEIDLVEINTLKAKNIEILRKNENKIYNEEKNKIIDNINNTKEDIIKKKKELYEAKKHKDYLIKCEDIAKQINEYDTPKIMNGKINLIEKENDNVLKNKKVIDDKLKTEEEKINTILNLLSDLKKSFPQNNNTNNNNKTSEKNNNTNTTNVIKNTTK